MTKSSGSSARHSETPANAAIRTNPRYLAGRSPRMGTNGPSAAASVAAVPPVIRRTKTDAGIATAILNPHFQHNAAPAPVSASKETAIIQEQQPEDRQSGEPRSGNFLSTLLQQRQLLAEKYGGQLRGQNSLPLSESSLDSSLPSSSPELQPASQPLLQH